ARREPQVRQSVACHKLPPDPGDAVPSCLFTDPNAAISSLWPAWVPPLFRGGRAKRGRVGLPQERPPPYPPKTWRDTIRFARSVGPAARKAPTLPSQDVEGYYTVRRLFRTAALC